MPGIRGLRNAEVQAVFKGGRRFETDFFRVIFKKGRSAGPGFAFVVPTAVDKRATARNRLRRRVREWIRKGNLFPERGLDVVFLFKKESAAASQKKIYKDLEHAISKIPN